MRKRKLLLRFKIKALNRSDYAFINKKIFIRRRAIILDYRYGIFKL